jgi:hypothetical protein
LGEDTAMRTIYPGVIYQFFGQFNSMGIFELELKKDAPKGEIISKGLFGILGFFQKTNEQNRF